MFLFFYWDITGGITCGCSLTLLPLTSHLLPLEFFHKKVNHQLVGTIDIGAEAVVQSVK